MNKDLEVTGRGGQPRSSVGLEKDTVGCELRQVRRFEGVSSVWGQWQP